MEIGAGFWPSKLAKTSFKSTKQVRANLNAQAFFELLRPFLLISYQSNKLHGKAQN